MANIGRWETVVSSRSKKGSAPTKGSDKKRAMQSLENMPKIESLVQLQPVKETPTMYEAFAKENKKGKGYGDDTGESTKSSPRAGGDNAGNRKSGKEKQTKSSKPASLNASMKALTVDSLEKALNQSKKAFPNANLLWLKDMASFLNLHFEDIPFEDPVHANERPDFPSCELPSGIKQLLIRTMQGATNNVLEIFFFHCVQSMVTDLSKGLSVYGYQITTQLLAYMSPSIVMGGFTKYSEILTEHQGRPLRCLSILWAIGQCGQKDLQTGLRIFFDLMFPLVSSRPLAPFILGHLDLILSVHAKHLTKGSKSLGLTEFFTLLDYFNQSNPTSITSVEMKKLSKSVVPKLKVLAYGTDPSASLHHFFPSYLSRVDTGGPLKSDILASLVSCLIQDKNTFSIWRQIYTKHLPQSGMLLKYLVDSQGSKITSKIDKNQLKETVRSFQVTNEELKAVSKQTPAGLQLCEDSCQPLLDKTVMAIQQASAVGRGARLFLRGLSLLFGLMIIDVLILSKGQPEESFTFKSLRNAGLSPYLDQVMVKTTHLLLIARDWVTVDLPIIYSQAVEFVSPYMLIVKEYIFIFISVVWKYLQDGFQHLSHGVNLAVDYVEREAPGFKESALKRIAHTYETIHQYGLFILRKVSEHGLDIWVLVVGHIEDLKSALQGSETFMRIWAAVLETWEIVTKIVFELVGQLYTWFQQNLMTVK